MRRGCCCLRPDRVGDRARRSLLPEHVSRGRRSGRHPAGRPGADPRRGGLRQGDEHRRALGRAREPDPGPDDRAPRWTHSSTRPTVRPTGRPPIARGSPGRSSRSRPAIDTVEHGFHLHERPDLLDRMAERGIVLVPTLDFLHHVAESDGLDPGARAAGDRQPRPRPADARRRPRPPASRSRSGSDGVTPTGRPAELVRLVEHGLRPRAKRSAAATRGSAVALGIEPRSDRCSPAFGPISSSSTAIRRRHRASRTGRADRAWSSTKSASPGPGRPTSAVVRPGAGISWTAQPLPSGSLKNVNRPHGKSWTSLASTPRLASSVRAASASADDDLQALHRARRRVGRDPVPMAIEQAEPGGVSCTKRMVSLTVWSWSG